jgi:signal transduction histidine kinase
MLVGMTLSRRMAIKLAAVTGAVALLAAAALWGLFALQRSVGEATGQFQLRQVYEAALPVVAAREALASEPARVERARQSIERARQKLEAIELPATLRARVGATLASVDATLRAGAEQLEAAADGAALSPVARRELVGRFNRVLNDVARIAARASREIRRIEQRARARVRATTLTVAGIGLLTVLGTAALSVWQHRSVMRPIRRIRAGVREIASGRLDRRLAATGDDELADLAGEVNRMAAELHGLYRDLERKVEEASRELVNSERLASVGYLAAGVAHEINNPLGIIAGHAELALRRLERAGSEEAGGDRPTSPPAEAREDVKQTLRVVCDEAFRCKRIIEKLLSLARGGEPARAAVSMRAVAEEVAELVRALPRYRETALWLDFPPDEPLSVRADAVQMKQVMLNLTLNALAAVKPGSGRVRIRGGRSEGWVTLTVADNGRGMDAATVGRVFEPFFTTRRGAAERDESTGGGGPGGGSGLGLSISHAIVTEHGGRLRAASEGPGRGSTFTLELPADRGEDAPADGSATSPAAGQSPADRRH